jgi:hypothetical protein
MEKPDEWGGIYGWASGAAWLAYGFWVFISKLFKKAKEEKMFTSLEIGGTAPEIQFAARLAAIEKKQDAREAKDDERHQQNTSNIERLFDDGRELKRMVGAIARKLGGME